MKLGVLTALYGQLELDKALAQIKKLGLDMVEIPSGNYPGNTHCKPAELLQSKTALREFQDTVKSSGLEISALACHGNPLHPDTETAQSHSRVQRDTIRLAEKLGVHRITTFSGCPGDSHHSRYPNWVVCPWPDDYSKILKWQWEEVIIPYWKDEASFAKDHGVRICIEMHPGFAVYNPYSMLRLRKHAGDNIGANFDPSHLFWQGIDPVKALRRLSDCVFHVHAKDTGINEANRANDGVLDTKPYSDEINRSWIFRTVGYGNSLSFWKDFVSTLRMIGYDDVLSIEHEDSLMSTEEGFRKAVDLLNAVLLREKPGATWWA